MTTPNNGKPAPDEQTVEERRELMELQKDHDERTFGVRPDIVLDATGDDADWIKRARFAPNEGDER